MIPSAASLGSAMIISTSIMRLVSLPLYGRRMYTRMVPVWRLSWDSYILTAAVLFDTVQWILLLMSISYGYGQPIVSVPPEDRIPAVKYLTISQPFYAWTLSCAKISVALCLLHVQPRSASTWRMFLWCMIVLQVIITAVINFFQFSLCKPLNATWDPSSVPHAECMPTDASQIFIFVTLAMTVFTDMTFSLLPISLLTDRRPSHEKVAICSIICIGLLATCASIYKTTIVKRFDSNEDMFVSLAGLTILSNLETQLGTIAASVPCLKRLLEKMLRWLGLLKGNPSLDPVLSNSDLENTSEVGRAGEARQIGLEATLESGQSSTLRLEKTG